MNEMTANEVKVQPLGTPGAARPKCWHTGLPAEWFSLFIPLPGSLANDKNQWKQQAIRLKVSSPPGSRLPV